MSDYRRGRPWPLEDLPGRPAAPKAATGEIAAQGFAQESITARASVHMRYQGTDTALVVAFGTRVEIEERFAEAHRARFGFWDQGRTLIVEAIAVDAAGQSAPPALPRVARKRSGPPADRLGVNNRLDIGESVLGGARYLNMLKESLPRYP